MEPLDLPKEAPVSGKFAPWQTVLIVLATWLISTAVNWGVIQQRQEDMIRRQDAADHAISQQVPRLEYDAQRNEINRRLDRIEDKIDTLLVKR